MPRLHRDPTPRGGALFPITATICLALILATWANSLPNGFHFDDSHYIVNNLFLRDLATRPSISGMPGPSAAFRPTRPAASAQPWRWTTDSVEASRHASFTPARSCT